MFAFHAVDDALADVLGVDNVLRQRRVGTAQKEVSARRLHGKFVAQLLDQLIDGAHSLRLGVGLVVAVVDGESLAVENEFDVIVTAGPAGTQLVGAAQRELAGACELQLLQFEGDDLDITVEGDREVLLAPVWSK